MRCGVEEQKVVLEWGTPKYGEGMETPKRGERVRGTLKCGVWIETPISGDGGPPKYGVGIGDPKMWGEDGDPNIWGEDGGPQKCGEGMGSP